MKLLIIGHARHGKDTVKDMIVKHTTLVAMDSSRYALETFLWDKLKDRYADIDSAYRGRVDPLMRVEWHNAIREYNTPDNTRLATSLLENYDIYVGMRSREEVLACQAKGLFDLIIWVDGSTRKPPEGGGSMTIDKDLADIIIDNNSRLDELEHKVLRLVNTWHI